METKKSKSADLEQKRSTFFMVGLTVALLAVLLAFKPTSEVSEIYVPTHHAIEEADLTDIQPTWEVQKKFTPPPILKIFDQIIITDNLAEIQETEIIFDEPNDPVYNLPTISEEVGEDHTIYQFPSNMPEFPGGKNSLNRYLSSNIHYPQLAAEMYLQGRVYLNFVVDTDGSISSVTVTRGVDKMLDDEAVRVIQSMPKWRPGLQNGKPVRVSYNLYINFKLE